MPQKDKFDHICEICNGIGELTNDHRYILRIQKLFENYVLREKKEEKPVKPKFQRTFLEINEVFDIAITEVNRIDAVEIGK